MSEIIIVFDPLVHEHLKSNRCSSPSLLCCHSSIYFHPKKFAERERERKERFHTDFISHDGLGHYCFCWNLHQQYKNEKNVFLHFFLTCSMNKLISLGYYATTTTINTHTHTNKYFSCEKSRYHAVHLLPVDIRTNHFTGFHVYVNDAINIVKTLNGPSVLMRALAQRLTTGKAEKQPFYQFENH